MGEDPYEKYPCERGWVMVNIEVAFVKIVKYNNHIVINCNRIIKLWNFIMQILG